jgi:hypothetical protein
LVRLLQETDRLPVVVVTVPEWAKTPDIDAGDLAQQLDGAASVFLLSAEAAYGLTDLLGSKTLSVHSGWVRVYPPTKAWKKTPRLAPSFRPTRTARKRSRDLIVAAALDASVVEGFRPVISSPGPQTLERVEVVVDDVINATQALVHLPTRKRQAILRTQQIASGLAADRLVQAGQKLTGRLKEANLLGEFFPDLVTQDLTARVVDYVGDGIVTLAQVRSVAPERISLLLHPTVPLTITSDPDDDFSSIADVGEVVTVEVIYLDGQFIATFSGDEPQPAISYLPDGPPWLMVSTEVIEEEDEESQDEETLEPPSARALDDLRFSIERLEAELREQEAANKKLRSELRQHRLFKFPRVFTDPEKQFRLELSVNYLTRVDEAIRDQYPMPANYLMGPDFIASVEQMTQSRGVSREKVLDVCIDVLCNRAKDMSQRALKEWTESKNGPQLIRSSDGAGAMRVRLQTGTAAARRLRYWQLRTGKIELDKVLTHDEEL